MPFITIKPKLNLSEVVFSIITFFEITIRKTRIQKLVIKLW